MSRWSLHHAAWRERDLMEMHKRISLFLLNKWVCELRVINAASFEFNLNIQQHHKHFEREVNHAKFNPETQTHRCHDDSQNWFGSLFFDEGINSCKLLLPMLQTVKLKMLKKITHPQWPSLAKGWFELKLHSTLFIGLKIGWEPRNFSFIQSSFACGSHKIVFALAIKKFPYNTSNNRCESIPIYIILVSVY